MANANFGAGCCCILALLMLGAGSAKSNRGCPRKDLGETDEDCPWAEVARVMVDYAQGGGHKLDEALAQSAPALGNSITRDRAAKGLFALWGESVNFDENVKATIIHPVVLDAIGDLGGMELKGQVVHAGLAHTYGYLLSNLMTPYGFKRARWVRPTLDDGFGLPRGTLGPKPAKGTLLANATAVFGAVAFRDDPERLAALKKATAGAAPEALALDAKTLDVRRLKETVTVGSGAKARTVDLRTDLVRLPHPPADPVKDNAFLLIYSVADSAHPGARLITGFPVDRAYAEGVFDPGKLGKGLPVKVRYNGHVPGIMGRELAGDRSVVIPGGSHPDPIILNDNPWPPFFFSGKADSPPGLGKELLQRCLPAVGREGVFAEHPIKRMRRDIENGELDINVYSYEPDRDSYILYGKEPIFYSEYRPVVRADSPIRITKIADFDKLRLGHLAGLTYSPEFKAYVEQRQKAGTLDVTDTEESNIMKLVAGRFDVYVNSTPTVLWLAKVLGMSDKIKVLDFAIKRADYFVTFSKASKRLTEPEKLAFLAAVDGCLRSLKKDGTHQAILAKYGQH